MRKGFKALAVSAVMTASIALAGGTASAAPADRCDPDGWCHRSFHAAFKDGSGNLDGYVSYKWHVHGYEGDVHGTTRDTKNDGLCIAAETYADGIVEMLPGSYV